MKTQRSIGRLGQLVLFFGAIALLAFPQLADADVMNGNDAYGTSSFNTGVNWVLGVAPSAGNDYFSGGFNMRTPTSGSHTFAGDSMTFNGGLLGFKTTGTVTVNNLILDGGKVANWISNSTTANLAGNITLTGTGGTFEAGSTRTVNVSAIISGSSDLMKANAGTVRLSGANTYTGQTLVLRDALRIENGSALGDTSVGTIVSNASGGGTGGTGTSLDLANNITVNEPLTLLGGASNHRVALRNVGGNNVYAGDITLNGGSLTQIFSNSGSLNVTGNITADPAFTDKLIVRGGSGSAGNLLSGTINIGTRTFTKTDGGTWTIASTGNTWGLTEVADGWVKLGANDALPTTTVLEVGQGSATVGRFDMNGYNQTVAAIDVDNASSTKSSQRITNTSGTASTLTVNNATTYTYEGTIDGNLGLTKTGAGTLTLSGAVTAAGILTHDAGTLDLASDQSWGGLAYNGGTLINSSTSMKTITLTDTVDGTYALKIVGGLHTPNDLKFQLTPTSGGIAVVDVTSPGHTDFRSTIDLGQAADGDLVEYYVDVLPGGSDVFHHGSITGTGGLRKTGGGTLKLDSGTNTYTGSTVIDGGDLFVQNKTGGMVPDTSVVVINSPGRFHIAGTTNETIAGLSGNGLMAGDGGNPTLTVNTTSDHTFSGVISGDMSLVKTGAATQVLSNANTYTGVTTISDGSLQITNGSALGSSAPASGTIIQNTGVSTGGVGSALRLQNNITVAEPITLATGPSNNRVSIVNDSGNNTLTGPITVSGNSLAQFSVNSGSLTINGDISGPTFTDTLFLRGFGTGTINGTINLPSANVAQTDGGTWTIASSGNTWVNTAIARGTLNLGVDNALPTTTALTMNQNGSNVSTFDLNGFNQTVASVAHHPTGSNNQTVTTGGGDLTVTGSYIDGTAANSLLIVGGGSTTTIGTGLTVDNLAVANDGGTASITVNSGAVNIGGGTGNSLGLADTTSAPEANGIADFSGASSVTINVGNLRMGTGTDNAGSTRGELLLSTTGPNTVRATNILMGDSNPAGNTGVTSLLTLGGTTNDLNIDTFIIGGRKSKALVNITSGGSLTITGNNNAAADLIVARNNTSTGTKAVGTLDLSGGTLFNATLDQFHIGNKGSTNDGKAQGFVTLAATNNITANEIVVGRSGNTGAEQPVDRSELHLGVSNTILTDTLTVGDWKTTGLVDFAAPGGTLELGSTVRRVDITLGKKTSSTGANAAGTMDLGDGTSTIYASDIKLGYRTSSGGGTPSGTLILGDGALNVSGSVHEGGTQNGNSTLTVIGDQTFTIGGIVAPDTFNIGLNGTDGTVTYPTTTNVQIGEDSNRTDLMVGRRTVDTAPVFQGTLDLSNVTNFVGRLDEFYIGTSTTGGQQGYPKGVVILATNNDIDARIIQIGDSNNVGLGGFNNRLILGSGTNDIAAETVVVGGDKSTGTIGGSMSFAGPGGTLNFGSTAERTDLFVGQQESGTGGGADGLLDLSGGTFNATLDQFTIGSKPDAATGSTSGTVIVDQGTINTNSLRIADRTSRGTSGTVEGSLTINNGSLTVNDDMLVGHGGPATLTVAGGAVNVGSGTGSFMDIGRLEDKLVTTAAADFSAASSVAIDVEQLRIGTMTGSANPGGKIDASLTLSQAGNNTIDANQIIIGDSPSAGNTNNVIELLLGGATNDIRTNILTVGGRKTGGLLDIASGGTLNLSGLTNAETDLRIGYNNANTGANTNATMDMSGATLNATLDLVVIGRHDAGNGSGKGTFTMDAGTVTMNSVVLANSSASGTSNNPANTHGTMNLLGGNVTVNGNIDDSGGTSTLTLDGSTLDMTGGNIGSSANPINNLNLRSGTLMNVAQINGGGDIRKTTGGMLVMTGDNGYTGQTYIEDDGGILRVTSPTALGSTAGITRIQGDMNATSRLELFGGVTYAAEPLTIEARQGTSYGPQFVNVSGNNVWTGPITLVTGGGDYRIQSDADLMTISGDITQSNGGPRRLYLQGDGDGLLSGSYLSTGSSDTGTTLIKEGSGTWTLSGTNTYLGPTTISAGTLQVGAGGAGSTISQTTVASAATLAGTGSVNNSVDVSGTVSPGDNGGAAIGTLHVGPTTFNAGSTLSIQLDPSTTLNVGDPGYFTPTGWGDVSMPTASDTLDVAGLLDLSGSTLDLTAMDDGWARGQEFNILDFDLALNDVDGDGKIDTHFDEYVIPHLYGDGYTTLTHDELVSSQYLPELGETGEGVGAMLAWDFSDLYTQGIIRVVPEPGTWAMFGLGLLALAAFRRRKK